MSLQIITEVRETVESIPHDIRPAINGNVTRALQNHREFTGETKQKNYLFRESNPESSRTAFQNAAIKYFDLSFSSQKAGDILDLNFAAWSAARKRLQGDMPAMWNPLVFWDVNTTLAVETSNLCKAFTDCDRVEARKHLVEIKHAVSILEKQIEAMPIFKD